MHNVYWDTLYGESIRKERPLGRCLIKVSIVIYVIIFISYLNAIFKIVMFCQWIIIGFFPLQTLNCFYCITHWYFVEYYCIILSLWSQLSMLQEMALVLATPHIFLNDRWTACHVTRNEHRATNFVPWIANLFPKGV